LRAHHENGEPWKVNGGGRNKIKTATSPDGQDSERRRESVERGIERRPQIRSAPPTDYFIITESDDLKTMPAFWESFSGKPAFRPLG
jgi:hypothetical protein